QTALPQIGTRQSPSGRRRNRPREVRLQMPRRDMKTAVKSGPPGGRYPNNPHGAAFHPDAAYYRSPSAAPRRRAARRGGRQHQQETSAAPSFDHLIRPRQQQRGDGEAEGFGGLEVDDQLELRGLLDWQV